MADPLDYATPSANRAGRPARRAWSPSAVFMLCLFALSCCCVANPIVYGRIVYWAFPPRGFDGHYVAIPTVATLAAWWLWCVAVLRSEPDVRSGCAFPAFALLVCGTAVNIALVVTLGMIFGWNPR